ncbi:MAG TPA: uL13 family ribosomal protein, partial [Actinomycetota bacterium]|nr:uL13 family ribosomal protein [Actinomycetota bacterium]
TPYSELISTRPEQAVTKAVRGLLPSNKLGRAMLKKLKVYAGPEHEQTAQKPKPLDLKQVAAPHNPEQAHTIEELSHHA